MNTQSAKCECETGKLGKNFECPAHGGKGIRIEHGGRFYQFDSPAEALKAGFHVPSSVA
jgi:hypothetical protein